MTQLGEASFVHAGCRAAGIVFVCEKLNSIFFYHLNHARVLRSGGASQWAWELAVHCGGGGARSRDGELHAGASGRVAPLVSPAFARSSPDRATVPGHPKHASREQKHRDQAAGHAGVERAQL